MKGGRSHRLQSHDPHEDWVDGSWTVDCVCGVNFDDGEEMVNCDDCGVWVHTRCSRYVKGDELFTCDKCKRKENRINESEETEVAQLLVELPTKTMRLDTNYAPPPPPPRRPFRLWTDIPMDERVHVQGIPGGDPALFTGLSSVFSHQLWKCTGYVPKKFNFQYREFPCWDQDDRDGNGKNEDENENTTVDRDRGAGVLFSLSKERLATPPVPPLVGFSARHEEAPRDSKVYAIDVKGLEGEGREGRCSQQLGMKKERNMLRPAVIHSAMRKKEDLGLPKDPSAKKKPGAFDKDVDPRKRVSHESKAAFTSTSDAKPLECYQDGSSKSFKNDSQSNLNKNLTDPINQVHETDSSVKVGNVVEKHNNELSVVGHSSEAMSSDTSKQKSPTGAGQNEGESSHEVSAVIERNAKVDVAAASVLQHYDVGRVPVKHEGDNLPKGNVEDNAEGSGGSDAKPTVDELVCLASGVKDSHINGDSEKLPSSDQPNTKVEVDNDGSRNVSICQSSLHDGKDADISSGNISEHSEMNDAALGSSPYSGNKAQEVDRASEAVSEYHTDKKADELTYGPCHLRDMEGSESSQMQKFPSEPKHCTGSAEEMSKSNETIISSPALLSQRKIVLSVGKSSSTSATIMTSTKSSASDDFGSEDAMNHNPNSRKPVMNDSNGGIKKDQFASDAVKDEDGHDMSKKMLQERSKLSGASAPKIPYSSKISHTSVLKKTITNSKDPFLYSSKASSGRNSSETVGSLENECVSHVQSKAPTSGLQQRSEKINQFSSQATSKGNHASSVNPHAATNLPATLSDEELALLLHQELNSSPRVPRVPRVRHAGSIPQLASPTATSMLIKRTSSSGVKDHNSFSRRKSKDASRDGFRCSQEHDDDVRRTDRVLSSPDQRRQDTGYMADALSKREDNGSPTAAHSVKKNIPSASTSTANSGPSSSTEVNDHHFSYVRSSPRNISDEETGSGRGPVHRTLPSLINEIMSKGRRMTYEELCNAVLPHWHNLRKHNGERYAYSSHSQAVLDCLRNRQEWARLVDRGPKTSSSRRRRKPDAEESEDNDYGKGRTAKEGESKSLESQRDDFPKGKRKARKRRRLTLHGRGVKDVRKRRKADMLTDEDGSAFSNSSEESLFSGEEIQGSVAGPVGSEASANSDETGTM